MKRKLIIKAILIIIFCVLLDIFLHVLTSSYSTMPENPVFSGAVRLLGTEITASLWALIAFSGVAFVYFMIQHQIPGYGVMKGLRYGTAIALLWEIAMLEGVALFGNSLQDEWMVGLSDAVPVFVLSVLLSRLQTDKESVRPTVSAALQKWEAVAVFTGIFLTGRYIAYLSGIIRSGIQPRPVQTLLWTLLMGLSIGAAFLLLGNHSRERSVIRRAVHFGFLVFGLNWAVFLLFMPMMFSGYIADVLLRVAVDTTLATMAYSLTCVLQRKTMRSIKCIKA